MPFTLNIASGVWQFFDDIRSETVGGFFGMRVWSLKHRCGFFQSWVRNLSFVWAYEILFNQHKSCSSKRHPQKTESNTGRWKHEAGVSEQRDMFVGEATLCTWLPGLSCLNSSLTRLRWSSSWSELWNNWPLCSLASPFSFSGWLHLFTPLCQRLVCLPWCWMSVNLQYEAAGRGRTWNNSNCMANAD